MTKGLLLSAGVVFGVLVPWALVIEHWAGLW